MTLGEPRRGGVRPPGRVDVARGSFPGQLGFGLGPHVWLGAALARLEAEVALSTLAARFPAVRLVADPDELRWTGNTMRRTVESLPVTLA
jgi:cytochrome P450